jgi:hypothetical protein
MMSLMFDGSANCKNNYITTKEAASITSHPDLSILAHHFYQLILFLVELSDVIAVCIDKAFLSSPSLISLPLFANLKSPFALAHFHFVDSTRSHRSPTKVLSWPAMELETSLWVDDTPPPARNNQPVKAQRMSASLILDSLEIWSFPVSSL